MTNKNRYNLRDLGAACQWFRMNETHMKQTDVAKEIGYSSEVVSAFETGRNNNASVLYWYFLNGLTIDYIKKYMRGDLFG